MTTKERIPGKSGDEKGQKTTRLERGVALAQERFEEIKRLAPYLWEVPSCSSEAGEPYHVNLKWGECSCPDRVPDDEECKHTTAARYVKARTATCDGCSERFRYPELVEVMEEHDSLTWFPGDLLCMVECAGNHGVL